MKISWRLIAFGAGAYLVFLMATLPASAVLARLQSRGIFASGVSGSIWNGSAAALQIGVTPLGATRWNVNFLSLFAGRLSADINVRREEGSIQATVSRTFGKRIRASRVQGSMPIAALGGMGLPGGWQGTVRINVGELELENNWPVSVHGTIDATNLVGPAYQPTQLGNFRVEFSAVKASEPGVTGKLTSTGEGPLDVAGLLRLLPNRTYIIDAQVATRAGAPASIAKALQYLGAPDSQGRRPMSISGSL